MNLHDIRHPIAHIDLIVAYCTAFYGMSFRASASRRSVEYAVSSAGYYDNRLDERDTLTYTNRALDWERNGRPRLR